MKIIITVLIILFASSLIANDLRRGDRCWGEKVYFYIIQGEIDQQRTAYDSGYENTEAIRFTTSDNNLLGGLLLKGKVCDQKEQKFMLIALGNAMRIDDYYKKFLPLTNLGIDVYIFDYRGFGRSDGEAILSDQVLDFRELYSFLHQKYSKAYIYGLSHGGVIALNALQEIVTTNDALILDSMPSTVPWTICWTDEYSPIRLLNAIKSPILIISGGKDKEVPFKEQEKFIRKAINKNKKVTLAYSKEVGHPFSKYDDLNDHFRIHKIKEFLIKLDSEIKHCGDMNEK